MKKVLILAALFVTGTAAFAQTDSKTANVAVTVTDIRTIAIESGSNPLFLLATTANYTAAASTAGLPSQAGTTLKVVSRAGYKVKAKLASDLSNSTPIGNGNATIPGSALGIKVLQASVQTNNLNEDVPANTVMNNVKFADGGSEIPMLSTDADQGGTLGTTFDVNYLMSEFPGVINLAMGTFTANVIYMIEGM